MLTKRLRTSPLFLSVLLACMLFQHPSPPLRAAARDDWRIYHGDLEGSHYSELDQINLKNVARLKVAWIYNSGDSSKDDRSQIQCNPLIVRGVLYGSSPQLKVFALNAARGKELWKFDPFAKETEQNPGINRGVVYWESGDDQRILFVAGPKLYALNAKTGQPIPTFGDNGTVDLREGLGRDTSGLYVSARTPGVVYRDLLIQGTVVSEGPGPAAPGHIRAYEVRTGKVRWTFRTIPHPGEYGYETWPKDAWQRIGGANAWTGITVDEKRGLVFPPTGSASFDFWGGNRVGANLFANCVLALKAETGERVWHYQVVHHDVWDRDIPAPSNLVTIERDGKRIDAVAQITKSGHVFVFNRETGDPLFPIEERPYPPSDLRGEVTWPTQPLPLKPPPFSRQYFLEEDITDISKEAHNHVLERFKQVKPGRPFIPPSTEGTIIFPGYDGGGEWGGAAFDPTSGLLYVNANEMPWILTMVDVSPDRTSSLGQLVYRRHCGTCHGADRKGNAEGTFPSLVGIQEKRSREQVKQVIKAGKGFMPSFKFLSSSEMRSLVAFLFGSSEDDALAAKISDPKRLEPGVAYTHTGYNRFFDPDGYPAVKPPWGTLNAIDLNKGTITWTVPLGEFPELSKRGVPQTGTENYGGPIVTAGGLIFIGASKDEKFRAFDKKTGQVVWETQLPAGGYATPSTYMVNGKQYVVIAAGGGKMGTKSGDSYVAFALSEE